MNFLKSSQKTSLLNRVRACILRKRRNKADLERTSSINFCRRLVKKNCQLVPSPRSSQEISLKYRGKSCSKKPQAHAFSGELQERPTEENSVTKSFWANHSTVSKTSYEGWNSVRMCARLDWYSSHKRFWCRFEPKVAQGKWAHAPLFMCMWVNHFFRAWVTSGMHVFDTKAWESLPPLCTTDQSWVFKQLLGFAYLLMCVCVCVCGVRAVPGMVICEILNDFPAAAGPCLVGTMELETKRLEIRTLLLLTKPLFLTKLRLKQGARSTPLQVLQGNGWGTLTDLEPT